MEHVKQALEMARQERQIRQPVISLRTTRQDHLSPDESQTQTITLDNTVLRENRIVTGLELGPFTEANNLLRTQVLQRFKENNWNVLAVTSPGEGEGKTLTAINLAISIAREVDYTVLLVDANLRNPLMLEHLGLAHRKGLSDYLIEDTPIAELLIKPGSVEHLMILPGGRPLINSSEALNSPKMAQLVKDMKSRCHSRIIIFDLPPVLTSSDALAFSPYMDATLLVIEEGVTQKHEIEHAIELLSSTNIIGTVLNKAECKSA